MKLADFGLAIEVDGDKQGKFGKFRETKKTFPMWLCDQNNTQNAVETVPL